MTLKERLAKFRASHRGKKHQEKTVDMAKDTTLPKKPEANLSLKKPEGPKMSPEKLESLQDQLKKLRGIKLAPAEINVK